MPGNAEENIYERLVSAPLHHPASASLFVNDWTLETGDIVSVVSNGKVYDMPIFSMDYTWFGGPASDGGNEGKAEIQSTGNQEREPLSELKRKRYASGSGAYRTQKEDHAWIEDMDDYVAIIATDLQGLSSNLTVTASQIRAEVSDSNNSLSSAITQTASQIRAEVNNTANGLSSSIAQTASQIRSEVSDTANGLHSQITQTASSIRSEVSSSISSAYHSIIEQTDSHIRSEVGSAVSGIYTSVIEQTGSYIRSEIEAAASNITSSVIEQTGSYIRSEIQNAGSEIYGSVILQTESFIRQIVSGTTKTYINYDDPSTVPVWQEELKEGDLWHKTNNVETWESLATLDWSEAYQYDWQEYLGGITYIRRNGEWVEIGNEQAVALNNQGITETAKAIQLAKADSDNNYANLLVTASLIRSEVKNTRDGLSSSITQTASQIRTEVSNTAAGLQSSITQNANQIELKVSKNGVVSSINQTAEAIKIQASKINLSGYVTADELSATNASISNLTSGVTQAGYIRTASFRAGSITFGSYALRRGYITVDGTRFSVVMWD